MTSSGWAGLQVAELAHERVVLGVGDLRPVERVVEVVVAGDQLPELVDTFPGRCRHRHRGEDNTPGRGRPAAIPARNGPARGGPRVLSGRLRIARRAWHGPRSFSMLSLPFGRVGRTARHRSRDSRDLADRALAAGGGREPSEGHDAAGRREGPGGGHVQRGRGRLRRSRELVLGSLRAPDDRPARRFARAIACWTSAAAAAPPRSPRRRPSGRRDRCSASTSRRACSSWRAGRRGAGDSRTSSSARATCWTRGCRILTSTRSSACSASSSFPTCPRRFACSGALCARAGSSRSRPGARGFLEPANTAFWNSIREVRPDLYKGFNPWDRICDPPAVDAMLGEAGVEGAEVVAEAGQHPIASPEAWWAAVLGTGYRGTLEQLDAADRERGPRRQPGLHPRVGHQRRGSERGVCDRQEGLKRGSAAGVGRRRG